jgi:AraC-like DNA-binding protein
MIARPPCASLLPFIKLLWTSDGTAPSGAARELVLPTGWSHLVFRLDAVPLRLYAHPQEAESQSVSTVVVGGARLSPYCRDVSRPVPSVGIQFQPGGAACVLGVPANELAGRHTPLDDLWGAQVELMREQLAEIAEPRRRLEVLEALLHDRLERAFRPSAAVLAAIARLEGAEPVHQVVRESGYSHRQFNQLFSRAVGLTPKAYQRVRRFQAALHQIHAAAARGAAQLAPGAGYADQAHLSRDFKAFTGLTIGEYRANAPASCNHVPLQAPSHVNFLQDA